MLNNDDGAQSEGCDDDRKWGGGRYMTNFAICGGGSHNSDMQGGGSMLYVTRRLLGQVVWIV